MSYKNTILKIEYKTGKQHSDVDAVSKIPPALPALGHFKPFAAAVPEYLALMASGSTDEDVFTRRGKETAKELEESRENLGLKDIGVLI